MAYVVQMKLKKKNNLTTMYVRQYNHKKCNINKNGNNVTNNIMTTSKTVKNITHLYNITYIIFVNLTQMLILQNIMLVNYLLHPISSVPSPQSSCPSHR